MDSQGFAVGINDVEAAASRLQGQTYAHSAHRIGSAECPSMTRASCSNRNVCSALAHSNFAAPITASVSSRQRNGRGALSLSPRAITPRASPAQHGFSAFNAVIIMPADAPQTKIANTRSYGAEVVFFDRYKESREAVAIPFIEERGMVLVPPYDDPSIMAGQGTIGLELVAEAKERGLTLDEVFVPSGGGGLISGISVAVKAASPQTRIWGVEPENFDDLRRSLIAGEPCEQRSWPSFHLRRHSDAAAG